MRSRKPLSPIEVSCLSGNVPIETRLASSGTALICGVDEAGRGPLAGPVAAAAVIFQDCDTLWAARDSKVLSTRAREAHFAQITRDLTCAVGICTVEEIDSLNILRASLLAMERAVAALGVRPEVVLVDGIHLPRLPMACHAIRHGDARVAVISAASIVAKVTRDRIMREFDALYPGYGFARHVGYPTAFHRSALNALGPCPIHRRTFHGVREFLAKSLEPETA